jgi:hypothetical protein
VVFLNTHLKMRSSSYYLAALSAADFGFLATLLLVWLNSNVGVQVFNKDGWCQGLVYISSVCSFLSVWLIVAFTVERFIAIQYPLHRPRMCTVARAKAIVALLAVVALLSHLYSFVTAGLVRQDDGSDVCDMLEEYRETMRIINIVDSLVTLIAPLILIIVMNTMIGWNLFQFRRRFRQNPETVMNRDGMSMERSDINLNQIHVSSDIAMHVSDNACFAVFHIYESKCLVSRTFCQRIFQLTYMKNEYSFICTRNEFSL